MRIILLGPPGCGKGTQGDFIQEKFGFPKISTGDLLRQAVLKGTSLGKEAEKVIKQGELVDDDLVAEMVKERIFQEDCREGYILDGFPRNIKQAQKLEAIDSRFLEMVIEIYLDEEILIRRIEARRICPECGAIYNLLVSKPDQEGICNRCNTSLVQRDDDRRDVIKQRLKVYRQETEPLIFYYQRKGRFHRVDGSKEIQVVAASIFSLLDAETIKYQKRDEAR